MRLGVRQRLANKTHGLERRAHFALEVIGQHRAALRVLALRRDRDAPRQRLPERARIELLLGLRNGL